jgi:hypothetical protein
LKITKQAFKNKDVATDLFAAHHQYHHAEAYAAGKLISVEYCVRQPR